MKVKQDDQTNSKSHKLGRSVGRLLCCSRGCEAKAKQRLVMSKLNCLLRQTNEYAFIQWRLATVSYVLSPGSNIHIRIYVTNNASTWPCSRRRKDAFHPPTLNLPQRKSYLLTEMQVSHMNVPYESKWFNYFASGTTHIQFIRHSSDLVGKGNAWQGSFKILRYRNPRIKYKMKYVLSILHTLSISCT